LNVIINKNNLDKMLFLQEGVVGGTYGSPTGFVFGVH